MPHVSRMREKPAKNFSEYSAGLQNAYYNEVVGDA